MKIERNIGDTSTARELGLTDLQPDIKMKFVDGWRAVSDENEFSRWTSAGVWVVLDESDQKIKRS